MDEDVGGNGWRSLFFRVAPVVLGLAGLVLLVVGGFLVSGHTGPHEVGTVGSCSTQVERVGPFARTVHSCEVTWQLLGRTRSGVVDLDAASAVSGQSVDLIVDKGPVGGAVQATSAMGGVVVAGLGVMALGVWAVLLRSRRRAASS